MRKVLLVLFCIGLLLTFSAFKGEARSQYKSVVLKLPAKTPAEVAIQKLVKAQKCNACHDKEKKTIRTEYGMKLHDALGGGDRKKYKFQKAFWSKDAKGNYSPKAIKLLQDAINAAAKKKPQ